MEVEVEADAGDERVADFNSLVSEELEGSLVRGVSDRDAGAGAAGG